MAELSSAELLARYVGQRENEAFDALFHRYAGKLTALARRRLSRSLSSRLDAEDVVQSAYRSFFLLARDGDIVLRRRGDLWRLLARITLRKVYRSARRHLADCRTVKREDRRFDLSATDECCREPADVVAFQEELHRLLAPLDQLHRRIVELQLQGRNLESIAADVGRSTRTVRRVLTAFGAEAERRFTDTLESSKDIVSFSDVVLHRQLGQGGMGKVYLASWRESQSLVAVKLLRKQFRGHKVAASRFKREAALLRRLQHPGIVALHGVGMLPDGDQFLIMDFVEGSDLSRRSNPSVSDVLHWVAEAAEAIEYAHQLGIVHCDLKPSNLLLGFDGRVRISDFGLARFLANDDAPQGGTLGFMAPEQVNPFGTVSPRTDVYGLGAVLRTLLPVRPPEIESLCQSCLAPNPNDRFASAGELAATLRRLIGNWS